jgi:competence protein ComEA
MRQIRRCVREQRRRHHAHSINWRIAPMFNRITKYCLCCVAALLPASVAFAGPVDINSADAAALSKELKGVGDTKAAAIVEYRRTHGAFKTLDDLALVKGIGQKLVDRNRADLRLGRVAPGATTVAPAGKAAGVASAAQNAAARK